MQAAGSTQLITEEIYSDGDVDTALTQVVEQTKEGAEYPLISKKADMKRFKKNYLEFFDKMITKCKSSIIYDDYLLQNIILWLTFLSGYVLAWQ